MSGTNTRTILAALLAVSAWVPAAYGSSQTTIREETPAASLEQFAVTTARENVVRQFDQFGRLEVVASKLDDELHGPARWFTEDGMMAYEANFVHGQQHGLSRAFYPDGTLKFEGEFQHGQLNGVARWFRPDGSMRVEMLFVNGTPQEVTRIGPPTVFGDLSS